MCYACGVYGTMEISSYASEGSRNDIVRFVISELLYEMKIKGKHRLPPTQTLRMARATPQGYDADKAIDQYWEDVSAADELTA